MDQVVVADAGAPGVPGGAFLKAAVEDRKLDVVGIALLERLFVDVCHKHPPCPKHTVLTVLSYTSIAIFSRKFNKTPCETTRAGGDKGKFERSG
jgi:hypothetical protein